MNIYWLDTVGSGNFTQASNWSTGTVPGPDDVAAMTASGTYTVTDDGGTTITVLAFTTGADTTFAISNSSEIIATDGTLTGANLGKVTVGSNSILEIGGTVDNVGSIVLTASTAQLFVEPSDLEGGGTITLSNAQLEFVPLAMESGGEFGNLNDTINGAGSISFLTAGASAESLFVNDTDGVIDASSGTLSFSQTGSFLEFVNLGLLEATGLDSELMISNTEMADEAGNSIHASGLGAEVELENDLVLGGSFSSTFDASIEFVGGDNNLNSVSSFPVANSGDLNVADDANLFINGVIDNSGSIGLTSTDANPTNLELSDPLTLEGAGDLVLQDGGNNTIEAAVATATLTNVNNTISGGGTILSAVGATIVLDNEKLGVVNATGGSDPLLIQGGDVNNEGLMEGTGSQGLEFSGCSLKNTDGTIDAVDDSQVEFVNDSVNNTDGLIDAEAGDTFIEFSEGEINNTDGLIEVGDGSSIEINQTMINGGTWETTGSGQIDVVFADLTNTTFKGLVVVDNADSLLLAGTIENSGEIELNALGNITGILMEGPLTLTGHGQILLSESIDNFIQAEGQTLTNDGNNISGSGMIDDLVLHNEAGGIIAANGTAPLIINTGTTPILNDGTLEAGFDSVLALDSNVSNSGVLKAVDGTITAGGTVTGGSADIVGDGEIEFTGATSTSVSFAQATAGAELVLVDAVQYIGTITDFAAGEFIDLADINESTATKSFSGGVLTVKDTDGDIAHIRFAGPVGTFALEDDGAGGTLVTDPPAATNAANATQIALLGSYMAAAFATAGIGPASAATAEGQQVAALHLALPHA